MSKAAIVLQARMSSARLPGKAMALVAGRPLLAVCIERLRAASGLPVILATTERPEDDCLIREAERLGALTCRGPELDVLARYVQAAERFDLTEVIRATGDNPAVDLDAPARVLAQLERTRADYVVERGLPVGAAVEAVTADALRRAADLAEEPFDREHVTPFIRRDSRFVAIQAIAPGAVREPGLRLTVDTPVDLDFLREVYRCVQPTDDVLAPLVEILRAADRVLILRADMPRREGR